MTTVKIQIKLIDGTETWIPAMAKEITLDKYVILHSGIFENLDNTELFEFYPGDIVKLNIKDFSDGSSSYIASELLQAGNFPDRNYREFMFLILVSRVRSTENVYVKYHNEIRKAKKERDLGIFIYPQISSFIDQLDLLNKGSC